MSTNKLLLEMYTILGKQEYVAPLRSAVDPTPREVIGTFAVHGTTVIDEAIFESVSELTWAEIIDIASLSTIAAEDVVSLIHSLDEGVATFRDTWNELASTGKIGDGVDRGSFVLATRACPEVESIGRYISWCVKSIQESGEDTRKKAVEKTKALAAVIPTGQSKAQHDQGVDDAHAYMKPYKYGTQSPHSSAELETPMAMKTPAEKEASMVKGLAVVGKAADAMTKIAKADGRDPDEAFPNLWRDLARERVRNS